MSASPSATAASTKRLIARPQHTTHDKDRASCSFQDNLNWRHGRAHDVTTISTKVFPTRRSAAVWDWRMNGG